MASDTNSSSAYLQIFTSTWILSIVKEQSSWYVICIFNYLFIIYLYIHLFELSTNLIYVIPIQHIPRHANPTCPLSCQSNISRVIPIQHVPRHANPTCPTSCQSYMSHAIPIQHVLCHANPTSPASCQLHTSRVMSIWTTCPASW